MSLPEWNRLETGRDLIARDAAKVFADPMQELLHARTECQRLKRELRERTQEQTCLSRVSRLLQNRSIECITLLRRLIMLIPGGWRFPEITVVQISYRDCSAASPDFQKTPWRQEASFATVNGHHGAVEICYLERPPASTSGPFLPEEQKLLNNIVDLLRMHFDARETEAQLRLKEQYFRALTENALDAVSVLDQAGNLTYSSPSLERLLGWTAGERIGRNSFERVHPEDQPRLRELFQRNLAKADAIVSAEYRYQHKDGSWRILESIARNSLHDPSVQGIIVNSRDVTDRRSAEEALRQSEERFRMATRATNEVIWERDLKTDQMWWSEAVTALGWFEDSQTVKHFDWRLFNVHPDDLARVRDGISEVLGRRETFWSAEHRLALPKGKIAHVLNRAWVVYDEHGAPLRMVGSMQDITEKRQLEAQFLRAQRLESIGTLASGVAHDLNNILAPVLMGSQLLRSMVTDAEGIGLLDSMQKSAERGAEIVRQLLSFGKGVEGEKHPLQLRHLLRDMLKIARETFPKNIILAHRRAEDLWPVEANVTQMHQVLLNLCVNARDAMPNGGKLEIIAQNLHLDQSTVSGCPGRRPGPYVCITVADTGCGMSAELQDKIFEPFFTTKPPEHGTGLGLSTVLGIVKGHHGFLQVKSEPGQGSEFSVFLPALVEQELTPKAAERPAPIPRGQGQAILLVDDEEAIRETAGQILRHQGYRVFTASDGVEALAVLTQSPGSIDLLLTDLLMPAMDGATLVRSVRRAMPRIRILISTGISEGTGSTAPQPAAELRSMGINSFVAKPFLKDDLLLAVSRLLA